MGTGAALFLAFDDIDTLGSNLEMVVRGYISSKLAKYKVPKYITIIGCIAT